MIVLGILLACLGLSRQCLSAPLTQNKEAMDPWVYPSGPDWWKNIPTWHQTFKWPESDSPSYEAVLKLANAYFNWVVTQQGARGNDGKFIVVAVLWNPATRLLEASTIPRGGRAGEMIYQRKLAPAWAAAAAGYLDLSTPPLCAEDAVEFNVETAENNGIVGNHFPEGSFIAIWGSMSSSDNEGEAWLPCEIKRGNRDIPGCRTTATNLDIIWKQDEMPFPWAPTPPKDGLDEGYPWDSSEDEEMRKLDSKQIEPGNDDISKRGLLRLPQKMHSGDITRDPPNHGQLQALEVRAPASTPPDTTVKWPTYTGTMAFPTQQNVVTTANAFLKSIERLTATGVRTGSTLTTAVRRFSCSLHDQDPDSGITSAYCVCQSSITLPLLKLPSVTAYTQSCSYSASPTKTAQITPKATLGPATTMTKICQICTPVENNEDSCRTMTGCIPQTAQVSASLGSSSVHVGTLTGRALYTGVSSALKALCPEPTQSTTMTGCTTETVAIKGVDYASPEDDSLQQDGELKVTVSLSAYNDTQQLNGMIDFIAGSVEASATGKSCSIAKFLVDQPKRWLVPFVKRWLPRSLVSRVDIPTSTPDQAIWCSCIGFVAMNYYSPYWHYDSQASQGTQYIYPSFSFAVEPQNRLFCEVMEAAAPFIQAAVPELAAEDVLLEEDINISCDLGAGNTASVNLGTTG